MVGPWLLALASPPSFFSNRIMLLTKLRYGFATIYTAMGLFALLFPTEFNNANFINQNSSGWLFMLYVRQFSYLPTRR